MGALKVLGKVASFLKQVKHSPEAFFKLSICFANDFFPKTLEVNFHRTLINLSQILSYQVSKIFKATCIWVKKHDTVVIFSIIKSTLPDSQFLELTWYLLPFFNPFKLLRNLSSSWSFTSLAPVWRFSRTWDPAGTA